MHVSAHDDTCMSCKRTQAGRSPASMLELCSNKHRWRHAYGYASESSKPNAVHDRAQHADVRSCSVPSTLHLREASTSSCAWRWQQAHHLLATLAAALRMNTHACTHACAISMTRDRAGLMPQPAQHASRHICTAAGAV